ncbi:MAG: hypothetical protein QM487_14715 [Candidatus Marithrix sp.]
MNVEKWVELFEAVGLNGDGQQKWHTEFEKKFPDEHQAFLEWLQIPDKDIRMIRKQAVS